MSENLSERQLQKLELRFDEDPVLHEKCRQLTKDEILSSEIQDLIDDMKYTCNEKKVGVGISANQVGEPLAISVIAIKPTPARPNLEPFEKICINTEIIETFGEKTPKWEGCISTARDKNGEPSMAQVPRFSKIRIKYLDRDSNGCEEIVEDFIAQVVQHETDHQNGILFTDLIERNSLISYQDYCSQTQ
ncbi:peptide deformylase [Christensenellaceae bacterium OttesenSCG-928-L17]|nr:peptide deformylase [Christensenellaceae bacterium OttesenSCG-928-L17]